MIDTIQKIYNFFIKQIQVVLQASLIICTYNLRVNTKIYKTRTKANHKIMSKLNKDCLMCTKDTKGYKFLCEAGTGGFKTIDILLHTNAVLKVIPDGFFVYK